MASSSKPPPKPSFLSPTPLTHHPLDQHTHPHTYPSPPSRSQTPPILERHPLIRLNTISRPYKIVPDLELITIFDLVGVLVHVNLVEQLGRDRADGESSPAFTART